MFLESELPISWQLLSKNESAAMEVELARETCQNHILHRWGSNAIANRKGTDDFLFSFEKGVGFLVVVSLTWKYQRHPNLPEIEVFNDKNEFITKYIELDDV